MFKQIAIIAPTASGKTSLSISLAHKTNSIVLSLDSLAVYKETDIASAKPTIQERDGILHFGIDEIYPNEIFGVIQFIETYQKARKYAIENKKNLIIVGGTSFYLKAMVDGLSITPDISIDVQKEVNERLNNLHETYQFLYDIDKDYMLNIKNNDKYRIEKALSLYLQTKQKPSEYFKNNPPKPIIENLDIYEIHWEVEELRKRIALRTKKMIEDGLIDEVIYLEKKYTRLPNCMSSIGIIETLEYLDGKITKQQLEEKIAINTSQLAKRQRTFNKNQFKNIIKNELKILENSILTKY